MELIRRETDYAFRALVDLARRRDDQLLVPVGLLVKRTHVPRDFIHKIMRKLVRAGIVYGRAGRGGGFRLARSSEDINLLEVLSVVQGPPAVNRCLTHGQSCQFMGGCAVRRKLTALQDELTGFLQKTTLAEVAEVQTEKLQTLEKEGA